MTYSVAGRCPRTGAFGAAVASSSPAVAARVPHVRAGVGVACTQNVTDPRLGPLLLDRLAAGDDASAAVTAADAGPWRQLATLGAAGGPAAFSGARTLGRFGAVTGGDCVAAGNMLASDRVLVAAVRAFEAAPERELEERLLLALEAGAAAGGEEGPLHSAGVLVAREVAWPVTDLRVDWSDGDPVVELRALWSRWRPERDTYVQRALDPDAAPGYGVPGDPRDPR